ncbi:MAG TPA: hypothetical protein VNI02_24470 [Blastocatellia bacterium]|jgi:hypothetical protein|nr:hypothetical protein [Blastocatellia bacterium]
MPSLDILLSELEKAKSRFAVGEGGRTKKLLALLGRRRFSDADSLIRFHESLLFLRAFPQTPDVYRITEELLSSFAGRVELVRLSGEDLIAFDYIESSGVAGTTISGTFSYDIARWLAHRYPSKVDVDWEKYGKKERLGAVLPNFLPLLYEDSLVEANVPYLAWLRAAKGRNESDLKWLLRRFESLPVPPRQKTELYDSLELPITWSLDTSRASRTRNMRRARRVFYHAGPLIRRKEVSLAEEFNSPPIALKKLSRGQGEAILDMARATTTVRYRELYGITHGDPETTVRANIGRGAEVYLWGLPPARRLPLRAYHAGFTLKNGVPINYIEGITLFDRMELGFNTFYTFREGETAWVYARVLHLLHQIVGVTCFSIDPYQIGFNNEEAIESGAFWFYRKLGFRPTEQELIKLAEAEEKKIRDGREYRTPARVLRRLSARRMVYEIGGAAAGDWDQFHVRNLGLESQRRAAREFRGDAEKIRRAAIAVTARALAINRKDFNELERQAFDKLALVLALIPDLDRWPVEEKDRLVEIMRAKAGADESAYARMLQSHKLLRAAMIEIGSA